MKLYSAPEMQLLMEYGDIGMDDAFLAEIAGPMDDALHAMERLEAGEIANPDEGRMVGHYWLRAPEMAPNAEIRAEIESCVKSIDEFVKRVHTGEIRPSGGSCRGSEACDDARFRNVLVCGIGGSSLGPEFISRALEAPDDRMKLYFLDNTDPAGMDRIFRLVEDELDATLVIVISKSGGTVETRNAMLETKAFYERKGVDFASHAICISGEGSKLWSTSEAEGWLAGFPMWDWVGGRTSVMSAVGLLPLGLQGIDTAALLRGAAQADAWGRERSLTANPAAIMAAAWLCRTGGRGGATNVVLPYRDSLVLLPKYLQQLVMESLGKKFDLDGKQVNQGLAVMGNKGSSDQHSYVQQLVAGPSNVFVTFIQVLKDREGESIDVDAGAADKVPAAAAHYPTTSGDYLNAFMLGTAKALKSHGKASMTISVPDASAESIGRLIALFERTVGIYAQLININAYHQPAVEAGKKAAASLIDLQHRILSAMQLDAPTTASALASTLNADQDDVFRLLLHLAATGRVTMSPAEDLQESKFYLK